MYSRDLARTKGHGIVVGNPRGRNLSLAINKILNERGVYGTGR